MYYKKYYQKKKSIDYSPLFPELKQMYNHNGKQVSMLRAYCYGDITKEQLNGEILTLTA